MKALKWFAEKNKVELIDVEKTQTVHVDNALIKVTYCGVCGTDLHIMLKEFAAAEEVIMGHEISGKICRDLQTLFLVQSAISVRAINTTDVFMMPFRTECGSNLVQSNYHKSK